MVLEIFKSIHGLNPSCVQNLFTIKELSYTVRGGIKLVQPKRNTTRHGLRSFSYLGSKLWNDLSNDLKNYTSEEFYAFKSHLRAWPGPEFNDHTHFYV